MCVSHLIFTHPSALCKDVYCSFVVVWTRAIGRGDGDMCLNIYTWKFRSIGLADDLDVGGVREIEESRVTLGS